MDTLGRAATERIATLENTAKESSTGNGEGDVRRLRRQFKSMKSSFIQCDVKDSFLEALAEGRPCAEVRPALSELLA